MIQDDLLELFKEGDKDKVKKILEKNEFDHNNTSSGLSIITEGLFYGFSEILQNFQSKFLHLDIFEACVMGNIEQAKKALVNEPRILNSCSSDDGLSPLHYATFSRSIDIVKYLISIGANIDIKTDTKGRSGRINNITPLHIAILTGNYEIAQYLLENGADSNAKEEGPEVSSLHFATFHGHTEIVKLLLQYGADKTLKTVEGRTPLDNARNKGFRDIENLLI